MTRPPLPVKSRRHRRVIAGVVTRWEYVDRWEPCDGVIDLTIDRRTNICRKCGWSVDRLELEDMRMGRIPPKPHGRWVTHRVLKEGTDK